MMEGVSRMVREMGREVQVRRLAVGLLVVVGVVVMVVGSRSWSRRSAALLPQEERKVLGPITLEQLGGGRWELGEHRGQVVAINFWASWCVPCWEETPGLERVAEEMGPKGVAVVGVSLDEGDRTKVESFVKRFHVTYPVAFPEVLSQLGSGMAGLPTTMLVDKQGRVAKTYVGLVRETELRRDISRLLGE